MSQSLRVSRIHFVAWIDTGLWRALAFTRSLQGRSPWVARQLRRTVLLLWWTATFQLHIHGRLWLRARRLRRAAPVVAPVPIIDAVNPRCLIVPFSPDPVVSVIVPTYGQVQLTLMCLASIADHAPALPIEVIVVDDAWKGADAQCLEQVAGIRLIRNETNLGYLHSCNKAAAAAKGHYLLLLNNDTEVFGKLAGTDGFAVPPTPRHRRGRRQIVVPGWILAGSRRNYLAGRIGVEFRTAGGSVETRL